MTPVSVPSKKAPLASRNVLDAVLKAVDEFVSASTKVHVADPEFSLMMCELLQGHGLPGQVVTTPNAAPHKGPWGDIEGFLQVHDGMGHDDASLSHRQPACRSTTEKGVEPDKHLVAQGGADDFSTMGRHIVSLELRLEDVTILLGVRSISHAGVLEISTLSHINILPDAGCPFTTA